MHSLATSVAALLAGASTVSGTVFSLNESYDVTNFFDKFDFFESRFTDNEFDRDPNHGFVNYQNRENALRDGLIKYQGDGVYIGVDHKNSAWPRDFRPSVRLESKKEYTRGLFIARFNHLPKSACGAWPAFWTNSFAREWPQGGEVDIYEHWNLATDNHPTFHTGELKDTGRCVINGDGITGSVLNPSCMKADQQYGCTVADSNGPYASPDGGVYAMEWTESYIKIFSWKKGQEPINIDSKHPDTSTWGMPVTQVKDGMCNLKGQFAAQKLILNINFCGDAAGGTWGTTCAIPTGEDNCSNYVRNHPEVYKDTYWHVKDIRYFVEGNFPDPTSSSTTTTTTKTTTSSTSTTTSTTKTTSSTTTSTTTSAPTSTSTSTSTSSSTTSTVPTSSSTSTTGSSTSSRSSVETSSITSTSTSSTSSATATSSSSTSAVTSSETSSSSGSSSVPTSSSTTTSSTSSTTVTSSSSTVPTSTSSTETSSSSSHITSSSSQTSVTTTPVSTSTSTSSAPVTTSSISSGFPGTNSTQTSHTATTSPVTSSQEWITSTVFTTTTYTVTSCAPTVTNCPKGHVVTETIPLYTTVCPVTPTATATATPSSPAGGNPGQPETTVTKITKVYTITSCAPTVTNCPVGKETTEVITSTSVCPDGCGKNGSTDTPAKPVSTPAAGCHGDSCAGANKPSVPATSGRAQSTAAVIVSSAKPSVASTGVVPARPSTTTNAPVTGLATSSKSLSRAVTLAAGMLAVVLFL